jgi:hypothetical protein
MSMLLKIQLPDNLIVQGLLEQKNIPCFCRIKGSSFELLFQDPLPQATGSVEGWSYKEIDIRAPSGAGGEYRHYCFGMVTLKREEEHAFDIVELSFFKSTLGWFPIVEGGQWCKPRSRNTQEELDELEAMFPLKKGNKKRQKLMDALAKGGFADKPTE